MKRDQKCIFLLHVLTRLRIGSLDPLEQYFLDETSRNGVGNGVSFPKRTTDTSPLQSSSYNYPNWAASFGIYTSLVTRLWGSLQFRRGAFY
ncbi:hypothetical protein COCSUDRAFT_33083 [Coccomyxa subellipsoidea C-169]|uniref:Uncharacterized protein n=1 Tax=Coccomyxa subellipsoidea (strain C-169) TaxID=574566 RepID=I0YYK7_COCSC|nr:hypothetical protein COCSUDRAFT_33083 [Coccomyxa subellipsoidea C-169]EIE23476.1 hypothetical protein COCSUDRAFT_33083 [Coccomyxa subellipsoidea C-169]|eukprot:XP_005648020.1 hypothetical protein COCSUDRAFT_33083 [Coccomyxa subellipsoidea C-169]